uniref:RNA-directed DNA polymerase, eukaryota, reverse transcriptase zinc-binding domain protein n=1 Tax=Tanacetum cinerariifolium TaxID=118510 RepID=A0A699H3M6_TANCI|nr:RNA-directed DNA polymerase, eukaryota, reverse transcriptase zinc-binding domain protein [Tanacetum cinerariifolium]
MWGKYSFDYACSMVRGLSRGIVSMWDPAVFSKENIWCNDNYVIVQGKWLNISHSYFMVNIYGPQDPPAKATLWSSLLSFAQHHQGRYVLFGDLNEVRDEHERFETNFSRSEAQVFNKFVADSGLLEMMMGGKSFTWMNKLGTKMSKLDWFLLSKEILDDNYKLKAIVLDRLWSDHSPILLHTLKTNYGLIPFKFFHSWFHRKDSDVVVKQAFVDTPQAATVNRKKEAIALLQDIDHKIDSSVASDSEKQARLQLLHEIHNIDRIESMDLFQKARIKWDIEGDENTKFFHSLIKQNRRRQAIQGIMVDGTWVSNPVQVKEAFLDFYKEKFLSHVPQDDIELFVSDFFATARLPPGTNSSFNTLNPKFGIVGIYLGPSNPRWSFNAKRDHGMSISLWRKMEKLDPRVFTFCSYIILVNGSPTSEFSIKRGLRQGDPLSQFLFILIMEGLHIAIKDATRFNLIKRVTIGNPETHPNCSVSDRFSSGEWAWHWSRPITSGRCLDMIHSLKAELNLLSLSTDRDAFRWGLTYDGSFTVGATRKHIDDVILSTLSVETS